MGRKGSRLTEQRMVPFQAGRHVAYPYDRPRALHRVPLCGLILVYTDLDTTGHGRRKTKRVGVFTSASPRCLDGGDVDLLHRHHRLEGTLCLTATSRKRIGQRARGDLPGEAPAVLAPTALAFRAAIADDRVPVTVRLFLILCRDLEGKGLGVPERRAAVETETGNAQDGELHRQLIALLAARIVTGSLVNSGYFTIRKGDGVEVRRLMRVFVEPEADRVLW